MEEVDFSISIKNLTHDGKIWLVQTNYSKKFKHNVATESVYQRSMNIYLYIICILGAFICGLFTREVLEVGKSLTKNLRRVRLEIDLSRGSIPTTENQIPQKLSENRLELQYRSVEKDF